MLKSIRLVNFFSFRDTTIELNPGVNLLIGINGSGKSNFLKALSLLNIGIGSNLLSDLIINEWGGYSFIENNNKGGKHKEIRIEYYISSEFDDYYRQTYSDDLVYTLTLRPVANSYFYTVVEHVHTNAKEPKWFLNFENGTASFIDEQDQKENYLQNIDSQRSFMSSVIQPDRYRTLDALRRFALDISLNHNFDTSQGGLMRSPDYPRVERKLAYNGTNLVPLLNTLNINQNENYERILNDLQIVNPYFEDIEFRNIGGNIELYLKERHLKNPVPAAHISDGTLSFLCLLSIFYNDSRGRLVCIDEPEQGLHPDMISTICEIIQSSSDKSQFILATHSENILNNFNLENIKVFEKDENNATVVNSLSAEQFKGWYDSFFPGSMWRAGDLGGNRW